MTDADSYTSTALTERTRQRLRDFRSALIQNGVPKGVTAPESFSLSATIDVALEIAEREMKKGKRR